MSVEELNVEIDTTNDLSVDYKALKNRIIKSCKATGNGTVDFIVEFDKLMELVVELGVTPICSGLNAHRVAPEHIPYLNEYFKDENLSWFTSSKFFTGLSFIKTEYIDERAQELLNKMNTSQINDPCIDKVHCLAELLAYYPCYSATVVAYKSNNPKFLNSNKPTYLIQIRANKVIITNSDYQYNYKDFS